MVQRIDWWTITPNGNAPLHAGDGVPESIFPGFSPIAPANLAMALSLVNVLKSKTLNMVL